MVPPGPNGWSIAAAVGELSIVSRKAGPNKTLHLTAGAHFSIQLTRALCRWIVSPAAGELFRSAAEGARVGMAEDIVAFLRLFEPQASDPESAARVVALAADPKQWPGAHRLFDGVRRRWLGTSDRLRQGQYSFEEICLKTLYNETAAVDPFDSDSAYYVVPCAIGRAWQLGVPIRRVLEIVAPLAVASDAEPGAAADGGAR